MQEILLKGELLCKLKNINSFFIGYKSFNFATKGTKELTNLIIEVIDLIIARIEKYTITQLKFLITAFLPFIETICGYISQSTIKFVPWNILPAFEQLFKNLFTDAEFILCPSWDKSYAIWNTNILDFIKVKILVIPNLLFDANEYFNDTIQKFLNKYPKEIYLIFFPKYEKKSALHFSLLGHEIGHIYAEKWVSKNINKFFERNNFLKNIESLAEKEISKVNPQPPELFKQALINEILEKIRNAVIKILKELLSDIFGILLFGETTLFSSFLFSQGLVIDDISNWTSGYLSWRFRLGNIIGALQYISCKLSYSFIDKEILKSIKTINEQKPYADLNINEYIKNFLEVYKSYRNEIIDDFLVLVKNNIFTNFIKHDAIEKAIERLNKFVPPNAYMDDNLTENIIDFRNILYATWIKILKELPATADEYEKLSGTYDLLSIKGIELSIEQERYNDFKQR